MPQQKPTCLSKRWQGTTFLPILLQGRSRGCLATGLCWLRASLWPEKSQHHRFLLGEKATEPKHFKSATLPCQGSDTLDTAAARGWVLQSIPWRTKADQSSTEATSAARQSLWQWKHTSFGLPNTPAVGLACLAHTEEISACAAALLLQPQSVTVPQEEEVVSNGGKLPGANTEPVRKFSP